jgi:hypothetical protein
MADHVIPHLPVRQWVLSAPKRLRYHLERDPAVQNIALHILISAIERVLRQCSPSASAASRLGAVVFIHRFGALLNPHLHYHCIVVDGMFDGDTAGGVRFHPASGVDESVIGEVQAAVRKRLLRAVERRGLLSPEEAQTMAAWEHGGGFSVDAGVRIEAADRAGLERLLRYCARPAFALERLREIDPEHLVYESTKPGPGGRVRLLFCAKRLAVAAIFLASSPMRSRSVIVLITMITIRKSTAVGWRRAMIWVQLSSISTSSLLTRWSSEMMRSIDARSPAVSDSMASRTWLFTSSPICITRARTDSSSTSYCFRVCSLLAI